ncbi:hypothetical protein J1P26_22630 [Neobacillus sp. MM2021_6]|uniref:hypothetical protein n=1 Tax=Bacillaceae TaxID=186817 RepID=UPI0014094CF0|nr:MULTISPECIES: hypothetical protein [Bacillaceae]MBO0962494.1 hypothetical protein [Neobacillus sp. MM2021_6]NHC21283.1 hypothetical protein [Bacillus sp. MM2020_4]
MINSEQAFDMLPHVVEIYEKLDMDAYRRKMVLKYKDKDKVDADKVGLEVILFIVKNSRKAKEEFFSVVAIAEQKTLEEVKAQSLAKTISTFKNVFTDKELMDFFKTAMQ